MKYKILICDDDDGIVEMLSLLLNLSGFEVISQLHSINIFDDITNHNPQLIILDLWMPGLSGDEISRRLKANKDTNQIPILISSASRDGEKIAYKANANRFISKPFDVSNLIDTVNSLLQPMNNAS